LAGVRLRTSCRGLPALCSGRAALVSGSAGAAARPEELASRVVWLLEPVQGADPPLRGRGALFPFTLFFGALVAELLRLQEVAIGYRRDRPLLSAISFGLLQGDLTGVLGPNGSGKTTFLKTM